MSNKSKNNNNEKVRLTLFAHGLGGGFHRMSPFAIVTLLANHPNEQPRILGRTEA